MWVLFRKCPVYGFQSTIYIFSTGFISKRLTEGQLEDENNKVEVELFSF